MRNCLILLVILAFAGRASAEACKPRPSWPTAEWPTKASEYATARTAEIKALEEYAFTLVGEDSERLGLRTDGLVIVQGGNLVYERYARGFDATKRHQTWSVSKSVTNALTAAAVKDGKLEIDDSICKFVDGLPAQNCEITVQHLLEFASGLDWKEIYENESNQLSSVLAMLYGQGHGDMPLFTGKHPRLEPPGTSFRYSTGESTLLAAVANNAMRKGGHGEEWPWELIFDPVGMKSATFERDAAGNFGGGSFFYANARDLAKFGWLFLNDGCWADQRILPENWVADSTKVSEPIKQKSYEREDGDVQGRQFWLNRPVPEIEQKRPWEEAPEDTYCALGHWGQSACIIPSEDMVVVRYANDRIAGLFDRSKFLKLAIAVGRPL